MIQCFVFYYREFKKNVMKTANKVGLKPKFSSKRQKYSYMPQFKQPSLLDNINSVENQSNNTGIVMKIIITSNTKINMLDQLSIL